MSQTKEVEIKVYATLDKGYMRALAQQHGLNSEAAYNFGFFNEVPLYLKVDAETGDVVGLRW